MLKGLDDVGGFKPRRNLGLVFQDQKLLFDRSALENVLLPLDIVGDVHGEWLALRSLLAHLIKLEAEGAAKREGEGWLPA